MLGGISRVAPLSTKSSLIVGSIGRQADGLDVDAALSALTPRIIIRLAAHNDLTSY